jgi:hypothetical protein
MADYPINGSPGNLFAQSVTIPSGGSLSEMIATQGKALVGLVMPSGWTAASIGYNVCLSGNTNDLQPVQSSGGFYEQCVPAAGQSIAFPSQDALYFPFLQLASVTATTVTPVTQVEARTIILLFRNYLS